MRAKMPQKPYYEWKNSNSEEKWAKSQTISKEKVQKMPCPGDLLTRTGEGEIGVLSGELIYV